jgi:putative solute:sodium symporter small subunit
VRVRFERKHAALLLGVAVWNVVTWTTFAKNLSATEGRPTGYYVAHTGLIVVNLAIAAVLGTVGYRAWRAARVESRP